MKPVVHFRGNARFFSGTTDNGDEFEFARVYALDHPRLGKTDVRTSVIVQKFDDGSFETLNTIYKPKD
jgi:hypothetical protein